MGSEQHQKYEKRIAIDARFILRPLRGMPLYVLKLCQNLPRLCGRYQFFLFINEAYEHNDSFENWRATLNTLRLLENVRIVNMNSSGEVFWEQVLLPLMLRKFNIQLLHMPGNRTSFLSGVPTVVTVHDIIESISCEKKLKDLAHDKRSLRKKLYSFRKLVYVWMNYNFFFKRSAAVITVSRYSAFQISEQLGIAGAKIIPIHHGVEADFANAPGETPAAAVDHVRNFVLMLGGDSPHKNPEGALAAWARVSASARSKYPLKIIGFCGDETSPLLDALRKHNLTNEVELKGWVSQEEMVSCMNQAALFLYLSRYEGFGFPLLHAMASGTPVISSNCTSIPEVLGDVGLKFDPDDYCGIAHGIETILNDREEWAHQSMKGMQRARSFDWTESALQHLRVYEQILERV